MSSRFILMAALILESRSTTCSSKRSLFLASRRSVAITCATELFNSGTRSRMSRMVCCKISSGSSVFSMMPPNIARSERFSLAQTPIFFSPSEPRRPDRPEVLHNLSRQKTLRRPRGPEHSTSVRAEGFTRSRKADHPPLRVSISGLPRRSPERDGEGNRQTSKGKGQKSGRASREELFFHFCLLPFASCLLPSAEGGPSAEAADVAAVV